MPGAGTRQNTGGPATRFQWGYNYLVGLLEMQPESVAAIEKADLAVLGELDGVPDVFHQRSRMRLGQLTSELLEWGQADADRAAVVESLRARVGSICRRPPTNDPCRMNCEAFLATTSVGA